MSVIVQTSYTMFSQRENGAAAAYGNIVRDCVSLYELV
jgi:hypothetical protein